MRQSGARSFRQTFAPTLLTFEGGRQSPPERQKAGKAVVKPVLVAAFTAPLLLVVRVRAMPPLHKQLMLLPVVLRLVAKVALVVRPLQPPLRRVRKQGVGYRLGRRRLRLHLVPLRRAGRGQLNYRKPVVVAFAVRVVPPMPVALAPHPATRLQPLV